MIEKHSKRIGVMIETKRDQIKNSLTSAERDKHQQELQSLVFCMDILKARINQARRAEKGMFT